MTEAFEEVSKRYRQWLLKVAHQYSRDKTEVYDLAQEGHIAMWKAWNSYDGRVPLDVHLKMKAKWRIIECRQRMNYTGLPSRAGKRYSAGTKVNSDREVVTDPTVSTFDAMIEENFDSCLVAYHHGDIHAAVNSLPLSLREKVYNRFWRGEYNPKSQTWWDKKDVGAKVLLREKLQHLRGIV